MTERSDLSALRERLLLPPEWSEALAALQGHEAEGISWKYTGIHDPKPIAKLLQGNGDIPDYVRKTLGRLLAPPSEYVGGRLIYKEPNKRAMDTRTKLSRDHRAIILIAQLRGGGEKFESAVEIAAKKFKMSAGWAKSLSQDDYETKLEELLKMLDPGTLQP